MEQGLEVVFTRCYGVFSHCPTMDMYGIPPLFGSSADDTVCKLCLMSSLKILDRYQVPHISLNHYASLGLYSELRQLTLEALKDPSNFEYQGIPFGKLAAVDLALTTRQSNLTDPSPATKSAWVKYIENSLISYSITKKILDDNEISRMLYFNDYSLPFGARLAAEHSGIPAFYVSNSSYKGVDRSKLLILPTSLRQDNVQKLRTWPEWESNALTPEYIAQVGDDILTRQFSTASHVFSARQSLGQNNIAEQLNIPQNRKLLVAFSSSLDEFISGYAIGEALNCVPDKQQPFGNNLEMMQINWLNALIDYVARSSDLYLIIRIHPRETRPGVGAFVADYLPRLKQHLNVSEPNCTIIWPEDRVSSYDLGEIADLALTCYSTIGLELARLGVPVLAAHRGFTVVDNKMICWEPDQIRYFQTLRSLLTKKADIGSIKCAFRFFYFYILSSAIDISEVVPNAEITELPEYKLPKNGRDIFDVVVNGALQSDRSLERLKSKQSESLDETETACIKTFLRRLIHFMFTGNLSDTDVEFSFFNSSSDPDFSAVRRDIDKDTTLATSGSSCLFIHEGVAYERHSALISRLAPLCASATIYAAPISLSPSLQGESEAPQGEL